MYTNIYIYICVYVYTHIYLYITCSMIDSSRRAHRKIFLEFLNACNSLTVPLYLMVTLAGYKVFG